MNNVVQCLSIFVTTSRLQITLLKSNFSSTPKVDHKRRFEKSVIMTIWVIQYSLLSHDILECQILHKNLQKQSFGIRQTSTPGTLTIKATGGKKVYFLLLRCLFAKALKHTKTDRSCVTPFPLGNKNLTFFLNMFLLS